MAKPIENVGFGSRSLRAIMSRSSNACLLDKIGSLDSAGRRAMQTHLRETLGSVAYIYSAAADANTSNCPIQANEGHGSDAFNEEATKPGWSIYGRDFLVSYRGLKIPRPMKSWAEVGLSSELLEAVERAGLKNPKPPEMATVPLWLHCRDVICISENRFSKTVAFILPLLIYISRQPHLNEESRPRGPYALVMAPYRDNLVWIEELIKNFFRMNIKVFSVTPGQNFGWLVHQIEQGCDVVIGTPRLLLACLKAGNVNLNYCNYIVVDQVDQMIEIEREPDVVGILETLPSSNMKPDDEDIVLDGEKKYRTISIFSDTMPPVEQIARKYLRNPVVVTIDHLDSREYRDKLRAMDPLNLMR